MTDQASTGYVLFFSRDIFFAANVKSAAVANGCQFKIVGDIEAEQPAEIVAATRACVVDLTPLSLEQVAQVGKRLSELFPHASRIAFGPHVQVDHFAAAHAAGFDAVLPKGQVASVLPRLIGSR